jgi:rSAM/selenodomain-associated transferase 1
MSQALIIFVRNPEAGNVKTRLAATLGSEKALQIYRQLLAHTLSITKECEIDKYVFYADNIMPGDEWKKSGYHQLLQKDAPLGEKMKDAFDAVFKKGHNQVIIIGSDCPYLNKQHISLAFEKLSNHDMVIGPANDGGYYLLGMKKLHDELFQNKQWSTTTVFQDTISDIEKNSLSYYRLPLLTDIDTEEDWLLFQKSGNYERL